MEHLSPGAQCLIEMFTALRNPICNNTGEITQRVMEMIQAPDSFPHLFAVVAAVPDEVIQQQAIYAMKQYIQVHEGHMTPEIVSQIRAGILQLLGQVTGEGPVSAIIRIIGILFVQFDSLWWTELLAFLHSEEANVQYVMQIFSMLFEDLPKEYLQGNMGFICNRIMQGLQMPDNQTAIVAALEVLFQMVAFVGNPEPFEAFKAPVHSIYQSAVQSGNSRLFRSVQNAVDLDTSGSFMDVRRVIQCLCETTQSSAHDLEFRWQLHTTLYEYVERHTGLFSERMLETMIAIEARLITVFFPMSAEDTDLFWTDDCVDFVQVIFNRMSDVRRFELGYGYFRSLYQSENPAEIFVALIMLQASMTMSASLFEDDVHPIFAALVQMMGHPVEYVAKLACLTIGKVGRDFGEPVTVILPDLFRAFGAYAANDVYTAGTVLCQVMRSADTVDPIFEAALPVISNWIQNGDEHLREIGVECMSALIVRSERVPMEVFDQIYTFIMGIFHADTGFYVGCFRIIEYMGYRARTVLATHVEELKAITSTAIQNPDYLVAYHGVTLVETVMRAMCDCFDISWAADLFGYLIGLIARTCEMLTADDIDKKAVIGLAANAVSGLGCICAAMKNPSMTMPALQATLEVARRGDTISLSGAACAVKYLGTSHRVVGDPGASEALNTVIAVLIDGLSETNDVDDLIEDTAGVGHFRTMIIEAITAAMSRELIISEESQGKLVSYLINKLTGPDLEDLTRDYMANVKWMNATGNLLDQICECEVENLSGTVLSQILPVIGSLMEHRIVAVRMFAIDFFSNLLAKPSSKGVPDDFKAGVYQTMVGCIATDIPLIAASAAQFIAKLAQGDNSNPIVQAAGGPTLAALMGRLQSLPDTSSESMQLKDSIITAMVLMAANMPDSFPIDEVLPVIMTNLPLTTPDVITPFGNKVYDWLCRMFFKMNDEMRAHFMRIFIHVISRPSELELNQHISISAFIKHREILGTQDDPNAVVASVLEGDAYRIQCYQEVCARLGQIIAGYMSIPQDPVEYMIL